MHPHTNISERVYQTEQCESDEAKRDMLGPAHISDNKFIFGLICWQENKFQSAINSAPEFQTL